MSWAESGAELGENPEDERGSGPGAGTGVRRAIARQVRRWLLPGAGAVLLVTGSLLWLTAPRASSLPPDPALTAPGAEPARAGSTAPATAGSPAAVLPGGAIGQAAQPDPRRNSRPAVTPEAREARRFSRYDRDKDGVVSRAEFLALRRKTFDRLDRDGDGQLSFEEYAAATASRFGAADKNADHQLSRAEFATTATRRSRRRHRPAQGRSMRGGGRSSPVNHPAASAPALIRFPAFIRPQSLLDPRVYTTMTCLLPFDECSSLSVA